jgi:predicted ATP-grasp superfamily ATP-dependent carboligase
MESSNPLARSMIGESILILGASARAAAQSARRAGLMPICGDLFADSDLCECTYSATAVADFPDDLEAVARNAPPAPWMYIGGIENHPGLVERIAAIRPLWGNTADVLRRVRNPFLLTSALRSAGLCAPECKATAPDPSALLVSTESYITLVRNVNTAGEEVDGRLPEMTGTWMHKGWHSSGGSQVRFWTSQTSTSNDGQRWYFQEKINGLPCAAVYVAAGGRATLLGVTEQLLAGEESGGNEYRYAGSIGPLRLSSSCRKAFESIGDVLAATFGLRGLFGIDAIMAGDRVWPVECNPRYTASIEVLERALRFSAVDWQAQACCDGRRPPVPELTGGLWYGKRIEYARENLVMTSETSARLRSLNSRRCWPVVADIPCGGSRFAAGQPVLTFLAEGADREEVLKRLDANDAWYETALPIGSKVKHTNPT